MSEPTVFGLGKGVLLSKKGVHMVSMPCPNQLLLLLFAKEAGAWAYTVDGVIATHNEETQERSQCSPHVDPWMVPLLRLAS